MKSNAQNQTNETARSLKARVNVFRGWKITDKAGNEFFVSKIAEVHEVLKQIAEKNESEK